MIVQTEQETAEEAGANARAALVYDGDCPVCSAYVRFVRLQESIGEVELINARTGHELVDQIHRAGLDLDEGMVLLFGGRFYHGVDCINMLAVLSSDSGVLNRLNAAIFKNTALARILYPVLRAGRNALLWILGRSRLELH
jgi:predicted DCC family thiol-disulfide oxidoreductase YuxK